MFNNYHPPPPPPVTIAINSLVLLEKWLKYQKVTTPPTPGIFVDVFIQVVKFLAGKKTRKSVF